MGTLAVNTLFFSPEGQIEFANLSGDWNPMHTDALVARRTQAGKPVVHGMNLALRMLDRYAELNPGLPSLSALSVRFAKPNYVGDTVVIREAVRSALSLRLLAVVDEVVTAELHLEFGDVTAPPSFPVPEVDACRKCKTLTLDEMQGRSGTVACAVEVEALVRQFPHAAKWMGPARVAAMSNLSRLVGMECPGLHSMFSSFALRCDCSVQDTVLRYSVAKVDPRFRLLKLSVEGLGVSGHVEAFVRQPPASQIATRGLADLVQPQEFAGHRVLVAGGSRGLGELTAKILAAGGGHPIITYSVGEDDALRVADEIREAGGECEVQRYSAKDPAGAQLGLLTEPVSYLYYFATGAIFRRRTRRFDEKLLAEFLDMYVRGFYDLVTALRAHSERPLSIFYPSSVAVESRPRDMTEYAMAKAAAELLCQDLNCFWPGTHITTERLPRLATDQTATIARAKSADSMEVMLPIIRRVQAVTL